MQPLLIVVPVLAAVFGPRFWAKAQLRRFDVDDGAFLPADELARRHALLRGLARPLARGWLRATGDY